MSTQTGPYHDNATALGVCLSVNVPVILWGPPGCGKTSVLQSFATQLGIPLETVIASIREPADFGGLPVIDQATGSVRLAPPSWAKRLADTDAAGGGIAFFDEISNAVPAVQAALLTVVLDRVVGDLTLPSETRFVGAANPPDIAADGWDFAPPLANRFTHLHWSLPASVVRDGFSTGWPEIPIETIDPEKFKAAFTEAKLFVGTFVGARPELATKIPDSSDEAGRAFPTPRSWESAAKLFAAGNLMGVNESVMQILMAGTVGMGASNEFLQFVRELDLPDPEKLLADPESFEVPKNRGDKVYAISASVFQAMAMNHTPERWAACGLILAKIAEAEHADIAFNVGRRWAHKDYLPKQINLDQRVLKSLTPILTEIKGVK